MFVYFALLFHLAQNDIHILACLPSVGNPCRIVSLVWLCRILLASVMYATGLTAGAWQ